MKNFRILAFFLIACSFSCAQTEKTKVRFTCTCDDQVGTRYAMALRDLLATGPRYVEIESASEPKVLGSKEKIYHYEISIVSVDEDSSLPGHSAAFGNVSKINDLLLYHSVQVCGIDRVSSRA